RDARDIRDDRLRDVVADEIRGGLLVAAANFPHQHDAFGRRVALGGSPPTGTMPSVCGSRSKSSSTSTKFMPRTGSPPMPTQVLWPRPALVVWNTASYVSVPERDTMPTRPGLWMKPGMMPILHWPGVMMPGQFGPISRLP